MPRVISYLLLLLVFPTILNARQAVPDSCWVDSVFHSLSFNERIAQLIIARANKDNVQLSEIPGLISKYNIGGLVFFKGNPSMQAKMTNEYQGIARTPLFVAIDAERGLGMRLDSTIGYPYMMTLGAVEDDSLIYRISSRIASHCGRLGIHINFAPVVDINSNPRNPVINSRSFGENREKVSRKAWAYLKGLQDHNILGTAKHFPGHGDTDTDSHHTLPVINHSRKLLDSLDLYPYQQLIKRGLPGIMIAHLFVPSVEKDPNLASTLSESIVSDLLKKKMGFKGLIFTDALEMKGVTNYHKEGDISVKALMAGNDVLLMPLDIPLTIKKIREAVDSCLIWPEDIDEKCRKVLEFKYKLGVNKAKPVELSHLNADLNLPEDASLVRKVYADAITLLKNKNGLLPLNGLDTLKIACLSLGGEPFEGPGPFLSRYARMDHFKLPKGADCRYQDSLAEQLKPYNLLILCIVNTSVLADRQFGIPESTISFLRCIQDGHRIVVALFGNPYAISKFGPMQDIDALLVTYQESNDAYDLAAQMMFGAEQFKGHLPVTASSEFPEGSGFSSALTDRISYLSPEDAGLRSQSFNKIDSLIENGLKEGAYPGCQVAVSWKGKVIYQKAYGYKDMRKKEKARTSDLYDLASLTKVAATTLAVMKLYEEDKIDLDEDLKTYLPELRHSNKSHIVIRDLMAHQAGLQAWIPFYEHTLVDGQPDTKLYKKVSSPFFSIKVADSLYLLTTYKDSIMQMIIDSPKGRKGDFKYSDLGFILLKEIVERVSGQPFSEYLNKNFYAPLGMGTACFRPLERFPAGRIQPTEDDSIFRKQTIRGYVHDPAAAMLGGISGHAGLFSTSDDLLILMQMLLNGGVYAGKRYFRESTVSAFTARQFPEGHNRRALGFDRPQDNKSKDGSVCISASRSSYGHSGFTGTYMWADPEADLAYVFLSNRINPSAKNNKLANMNIRTEVHEAIYEIIRSKH